MHVGWRVLSLGPRRSLAFAYVGEFGFDAGSCGGVDAFLFALSGFLVFGEFDSADPEFVFAALKDGAGCLFASLLFFRHNCTLSLLYSIRVFRTV